MLSRVNGAGTVRVGEYFLADEALMRESLTLLTGTLRAQLAEVLATAKLADTDESWRNSPRR